MRPALRFSAACGGGPVEAVPQLTVRGSWRPGTDRVRELPDVSLVSHLALAQYVVNT